jgi:hypothetical protein
VNGAGAIAAPPESPESPEPLSWDAASSLSLSAGVRARIDSANHRTRHSVLADVRGEDEVTLAVDGEGGEFALGVAGSVGDATFLAYAGASMQATAAW